METWSIVYICVRSLLTGPRINHSHTTILNSDYTNQYVIPAVCERVQHSKCIRRLQWWWCCCCNERDGIATEKEKTPGDFAPFRQSTRPPETISPPPLFFRIELSPARSSNHQLAYYLQSVFPRNKKKKHACINKKKQATVFFYLP